MCFSHLCVSALYSSHSCGSSFSGRRERGNATGLRPGHVPCQFAIAMCGAGGRGEDAQVRVCRVGITSWRFGSVRRPSRMGAGIGRSASGFGRARARGRVGAAAASGEARRARASNVRAFLIQKSRSVKSQSSELPRPSKMDLHGSRASTRGSSSVPLRFLSSDHARPVPLRLLSGTHAASRRSLNAVMPSLASSEWKSF